jgi:hypothetical protein
MKEKRERKWALARECWTHKWKKELILSKLIHCSIVLFFHKMPSHRNSSPLATISYLKLLPQLLRPPWPLMVLLLKPKRNGGTESII